MEHIDFSSLVGRSLAVDMKNEKPRPKFDVISGKVLVAAGIPVGESWKIDLLIEREANSLAHVSMRLEDFPQRVVMGSKKQ